MDYNDLEHETIRLLTNGEKGGRTEVAEEISKRYREIMVDEYQDTNETQDTIFRAISQKGKNLVMVGDVKQSIYRFRNADPGIFLEKYNAYETEPKENNADRKVFLSHNFRSRPEILDAANFVFSTVMSPEVGDVEYGEDEALRPNPFADYPAVPGDAIELHLIDAKDAALSKEEAEAEFVADRIRSLLDGENYIYDKNVLRRIRADVFLFSVQALTADGELYDCYAEEVATRSIMLANSKRRILLCDSSKLGRSSTFYLANLSDVDLVVSDRDLNGFFKDPTPEKYILAE